MAISGLDRLFLIPLGCCPLGVTVLIAHKHDVGDEDAPTIQGGTVSRTSAPDGYYTWTDHRLHRWHGVTQSLLAYTLPPELPICNPILQTTFSKAWYWTWYGSQIVIQANVEHVMAPTLRGRMERLTVGSPHASLASDSSVVYCK